jgi:ligand-binding sensor domain-containing protein/signal transduction histidine kinase
MPIRRHLWSACCLGLLFLACLRALALDPRYPLRHYGYQAWQTDDGLPQNTVHAVLQTRDGFLWFATEAGLVRFDGAQFAVFDKSNTPQFTSGVINSLLEDKDGRLWISTADGLVELEKGHLRAFRDSDGLPSAMVFSVYQDHRGRLWAFTAAGVARYENGHFVKLPGVPPASFVTGSPDGTIWFGTGNGVFNDHGGGLFAGEQIQAMAAGRDGRLWIGSHQGLKFVIAGKAPQDFHLPANLGSDIASLLVAGDGHLWIGTANGLAEFDGKTTHVLLSSERISALFEDREHAIWAATGRGIARIVAGKAETMTSQQGLSSNQALAFYEDREGNLWIGTESGGVCVLRDRKFTTFTSQDGMTDDLARSVFQSRNGTIYVGTNSGGVDQYVNGKFMPLSAEKGLSSQVALALADDAQGDLWVGTPDGLDRISNGRTKIFTSADGLSDDFVRSLYEDRDGVLWIGTRRGLTRYQNGEFTSWSALDGLGSDLVGAVIQDQDGSHWIGTLAGLTHFANGHFTNYPMQQAVTALYEDSDGTLWIGTNGGGLGARQDGKFVSFPAARSHLPPNIYGILEDANQNLWLATNKGVYRVSKRGLRDLAAGAVPEVHPEAYGTSDGMRISECSSGGHPAAWKAKDGTLWFATLRGVAMVDPANMPVNRVPPLVAIEQMVVDDLPLAAQPGVRISPGHTRFAFQYAGLSFAAPQKVRFRYKLDGVDRDWVDAGARRTAYYTNVPPGEHTFRVMACNNDGIWSEQASTFTFRLFPRFYQTWWFYLLLLFLVALLVYAVYRWRVRNVESRFNAVLAERNRIAREIHDTLAQGFIAVSVQLEVVARLLNTSVDAAKEHLEQARRLTRDCIQEARSSIWNLRSQGAGHDDLAAVITSSAERVTANSGTKARIHVGGTRRPVSAAMAAELVRIAQEAMTNAVRHAQAEHIDVTLLFEEKLLRITIKDDGCGFEDSPEVFRSDGHFGLTGMRERAAQIGAKFEVISKKGCGTEVRVDVPI